MRITLALLLLTLTAPLLAQDRGHVGVFVSRVDIDSADLEDGFETDFDSGNGFGFVADRAFNRILSAEVAVFSVRSEAGLLFEGAAPFDLGDLNLVPVMFGAQAHLAGRSRIDPYIGAGAAYVMANDLHSEDLDAVGLGRIEVDNELTYYASAGVAFELTRGLGIVVDGRWVHFEPSTQAAGTGEEEDVELSPLIISAGLRFRF